MLAITVHLNLTSVPISSFFQSVGFPHHWRYRHLHDVLSTLLVCRHCSLSILLSFHFAGAIFSSRCRYLSNWSASAIDLIIIRPVLSVTRVAANIVSCQIGLSPALSVILVFAELGYSQPRSLNCLSSSILYPALVILFLGRVVLWNRPNPL